MRYFIRTDDSPDYSFGASFTFIIRKNMTINAEQLYFILDNTPPEQNIMLVGKHGIGKSRILEEYYSEKKCKVVTLFLGQMSDPGDLIGLPEKNEKTGKTDFMLPYWFPLDKTPVVLFLDELNRARPEVLQTIMDLALNRKLAGKTLPEGSRIISAVNNGGEYQLTDLDPALVSRFNIYEFSPTVGDWLKWAETAGIDERICSFIKENPEYLDGNEQNAELQNLERTPDRRSWERVSSIIKKSPELSDCYKTLVSGIVGNKAASVFFRFINENTVPSAKEILFGDFKSAVPKLEKLNVPLVSQVSSSLFNFIEAKSSEIEVSPEKTAKISENLVSYFEYLEKTSRESVSYFASLWSANEYPLTLAFIGMHCIDLYKKLMAVFEE